MIATGVVEYDANPKDYDTSNVEAMLKIDRESAAEDMSLLDDAHWEFRVEDITDCGCGIGQEGEQDPDDKARDNWLITQKKVRQSILRKQRLKR